MPRDLPMYKKEGKNLQAWMLETKHTYYQLVQHVELLPIKQRTRTML